MGSVSYAKHIVYKGSKITDPQDSVAITTKLSYTPSTVLVMNHDGEVMSLENKTECELLNSEEMAGINDSHTVNVIPNMGRQEQETLILCDFQEQLQSLEGSEVLVSSKMCSKPTKLIIDKEQDLVADGSFSPFSEKYESELSGTEVMLNDVKMEAGQGDIVVESDKFTENQDKSAPIKFHINSSSLLDVSFTSSDNFQMNMSLESLLSSHLTLTKKRNRGTLEFGNIDSQTPANKEAVNSGNCLRVNLDIKGNDLDHTAIQTLQDKYACVLENLTITELFAAVSEMHRSLRILLSFFLFWVIEVKCRPQAKGEECFKTKRGLCS